MGQGIRFDIYLLVNFGYTTLYTFTLLFAYSFVFQLLDKIFESERFSKKELLLAL